MVQVPSAAANGECPVCAMPVSFGRANLWRRGKPFDCKGCGRLLTTDKARFGIVLGAFALASLLGRTPGLLAVLGVAVALAIYEWLTVRVRLADEVGHGPQ